MAKRLIHSTNIVDYHLETFEGVEMISRYQLFRQLVADELSEDKAQILAEPIKDLDHNRVNWYTSLTGPVQPFESLAKDDQRFAIDMVAERASDLMELSRRFLASNSRNRKLAGELVANILNRSRKYNIYMVGDRPVVVGWGLTSIHPEDDAELSESISNLLREKLTQDQPDPNPKSPPASPKAAPTAAVASPKPPRDRRGRSPLWLWLGCFLGLIFLTILFWWLFWSVRPLVQWTDFWPFSTENKETQPPASRSLVIPKGAEEKGDMSFLEGCWASSSESLVNMDTDLPIVVKYCFDQSGQAKVTLDETDENGQIFQTCPGQARATFKDGGVVITETVQRVCPDGRNYSKSVMVCKPKATELGVDCVIIQENVSEEVRSDFNRLS
ncbi:MAG: hypothetical protein LBT38_06185 [Deltaproteobacteria bacterium]|jgi:hypothetical protein|nr:hypothetical protein [Deltaproteobacteria bacterium]